MTILKAYLKSYEFSDQRNCIEFLFGDSGRFEFSIKKFKDKEVLKKAFNACSGYKNKELEYQEIICRVSFSQDKDLEPILEDLGID